MTTPATSNAETAMAALVPGELLPPSSPAFSLLGLLPLIVPSASPGTLLLPGAASVAYLHWYTLTAQEMPLLASH